MSHHYSPHHHNRRSRHRHQPHREYHPHNATRIEGDDTIVVLPSTSRIMVDESQQVTSSSLESGDLYGHHRHGIIPSLPQVKAPPHIHTHSTKSRWKWSKIPNIINVPPERIRGAILNHGETYWKTTERSTRLLIEFSGLQLVIYLLVFGLSAPHKVLLGLMPVRDYLIAWFILMSSFDFLAHLGILVGRWISKKFDLPKKADMYFILFSTILLIVGFVASITFPIFGSFNLMTKVQGTIIMKEENCIEARDKFSKAGTDWTDIPDLKLICDDHIVCLKSCRDFRDMFVWIFGTYFLAVFRFFILVSLWNSCSFLCIIMDLHEEHISYTFSLSRGNVH